MYSRAADCTAELTFPSHTQQRKFYNTQTTHPHLASKLRMSGDMSPPPIYLYGMHSHNFTFTFFFNLYSPRFLYIGQAFRYSAENAFLYI